MITPELLSIKDAFIPHIGHKLGQGSLDFSEKWQSIKNENHAGKKHGAAGVLLLLHNRPLLQSSALPASEFVLQLIKRSGRVPQGGDISCPGGMLEPLTDHGLALLTYSRIIPVFQGLSRDYARKRPSATYRLINLFLANALRESWEEIRLNPFNVEFLGPLPTYSLSLFRRTIFPLVAYVKTPWRFRPNPEVDKVIEIPLKHFFDINNYAVFTIESSSSVPTRDVDPRHLPCFVHKDKDHQQEILWGATFYIIMNFLAIVFDYQLPAIPSTQQFSRVLSSDYITGRHNPLQTV
jgi:8-oxo-dGTP pyrophosphatase MutT (NUDIX family)